MDIHMVSKIISGHTVYNANVYLYNIFTICSRIQCIVTTNWSDNVLELRWITLRFMSVTNCVITSAASS